MNNHFQTIQAQSKTQAAERQHKTLYPGRKSISTEHLALGSYNRANNWTKEKLIDDDILKALKNGVIPLKHADQHDFRTPENEVIDSKNNIYVRKYLPASQRAEAARKDHQSAYLEHVPFVSPKNSMEKGRVPEKEVGPLIRHGVRTQSERLNSHLNGSNRLIDHAIADNKMIYNPSWRYNEKNKWSSPRGFDTTTCLFQGRRSFEPWKTTSLGINIGDGYFDGFDVVGDLSRKRKQKLELSQKDFMTTVTPNHSSLPFQPPIDSNTIRTSKSAKFVKDGEVPAKTYPQSMRHALTQDPDFNETPKTSRSNSTAKMPKVIQIKTGILEPMKESYFSTTGGYNSTKARSDSSPMIDKSFRKTGFGATRRTKYSPDRGEYIKTTVKSYFD